MFDTILIFITSPVIALIALLDFGNGKTFKQNFDLISAKGIKVEGPSKKE